MLPTQKIALAAHMHVLLRRKTGRVTDTEWMVENADYAREVVRFARGKAREAGDAELGEQADRLEQVLLGTPAAPAFGGTALDRLRARHQAQAAPPSAAAPAAPPASGPRYIGGIR